MMNVSKPDCAVILAAGIGSRLRPLTNEVPKCLVECRGKKIIDYQLDAYKNAGISNIVVIVGYEADKIVTYLREKKDFNFEFVYNHDYENTNNMYSFYLASYFLKGKAFVLNNADLAVEVDLVERLCAAKYGNMVAYDASIYNEEAMKITLDSSGGHVSGIAKTIGPSEAAGASIDFYKFSKEASVNFIEKVRIIVEEKMNRRDWTEVALDELFREGEEIFYPLDISGMKWVEIDGVDDLLLAERVFSDYELQLGNIENIVFDLDGTIYKGNTPIEGVISRINELSRSKRIYFLTNNSSKTKVDVLNVLNSMGINCEVDQVIASYEVTIDYLKNQGINDIYLLATQDVENEFVKAGININSFLPEVVIFSYDKELSYKKLEKACALINSGVKYIATHGDMFCPTENGPVPDVGAFLEMIYLSTGIKCSMVLGKPHEQMVEKLKSLGLVPEKTMVVGDRLHTDIALANRFAAKSALVLTGESGIKDYCTTSHKVDYVFASVASL